MTDSALRVIPLGGLGEVGKNMTVFELGDQIIVVDAGLAFPRDEHLGVDLVLPDFGYLSDREVLAVLLTHAHEDHVGGLPYLLREVRVREVWATRLTLGMISSKLDEHGLQRSTELREMDPEGQPVDVGPFRLEFVRMAHSVPDAVGIAITTSAGTVFHTGDWKLDHTPIDGLRTDVGRLAELGNRGVDLLLGDSTNAERPGFTRSERVVGEAFRQIIPQRSGRVLITSFASNIHRMQQAIDVAAEVDRKVAVIGRSMRKNLNIARNLEYVHAPDDILIRPVDLDDLEPHQQLILCTGSQGEPLSALTRIAYNDHPAVQVERGDTVIMSARAVPGNELRVHDAINRLVRNGAEVLHEENSPVHVSGHACSEEMRTLLGPDPAEGGDADPRRVPHAGGARAARAGRRRAGLVDRDRRERRRRRALQRGRAHRRPRRVGRHVRRRSRRRGHLRRGAARPAAPLRGRRADRRDDALERHLGCAGADLARLRRVGRPDGRDAAARPTRSCADCSTTTSARSSSCRSTSTTASASSSTTARAAAR